MKGKKLQPRILYPARLSFISDGEIKSFPDKQKLREFKQHQNSCTTNAKGTSLGRKQKRRKRPTEGKPKTIKKTVIGSDISIITLNVNGLNAPSKRHRLEDGNMYALPLATCLRCAASLSSVRLFTTPRTTACQAPLSMGILQARILE